MGVYEVTAPDGAVYEVEANSPQAARDRVMRFRERERGATERRTAPAVLRAPDALVRAVADGALAGFADEGAGSLPGGRSIEYQRGIDQADAEDYPWTRTAGQVAGAIAAPVAALPRAAAALFNSARLVPRFAANAAQGGLYGLGAAEGALAERAPEAATSAVVSGVVGEGGRAAIRGVGSALAPRVDPAVQRLRDAGVRLTPGQIMGGVAKNMEDLAVSLPIAGPLIAARRNEGIEQFAKAAVNEAAAPIGWRASAKATPQEAIAGLQRATGIMYERTARGLRARLDRQLQADLAAVQRDAMQAGGLGEAQQQQFKTILENRILRYMDQNGELSGTNMAKALSDMRRLASQYGSAADPSQRELGRVLGGIGDALESAAERHSGKGAWKAFADARSAYANRTVIDRAGAAAAGGSPDRAASAFTPAQLLTAVRQGDRSARKGAVARGAARMQGFARTGQSVLPATTGDSGTAQRSALWALGGLTGGALLGGVDPLTAAGALGAYGMTALPYTQRGASLLEQALIGNRPPAITVLGRGARRVAPLLGTAAGIGAAQSVANR